MRIVRPFSALTTAAVLAACGGGQQSATPGVPVAAQAIARPAQWLNARTPPALRPLGMKPDKVCPSNFVYCVTLSASKSAQLYFCYSPSSFCGPSQFQYTWYDRFYTYPKGKLVNSYFGGGLNPNPGDPTYDTISEAVRLKSTHGKIKYEQFLCPVYASGESCLASFYVGIRIK